MICRLCGQDKELANSHIIPEFMYRPLYDEKHKMITLSTNPNKDKPLQKGLREKLLCSGEDGCEQKLGVWESYASQVLFHMQLKHDKYDDAIVVKDIDYTKFKLFQLSLLWRASISSLQHFSNVKLGPHEDKIRNMLINNDPGEPHKYGCIMVLPTNLPKGFEQLIIMPGMMRHDKHRCYYFFLNGYYWLYFVSSHTYKIPVQKYFLLKQNILPIPLTSNEALLKFIIKFGLDLKELGKI